MTEVYKEDRRQLFTPIDASKTVAILALGAVIGLLVWALSLVLDRYVFAAIFCQGAQVVQCASTASYAETVATVLAAIAGLFFLVRLQVFRPLLVVLATMIGLWGVVGFSQLLPGYGIGLAVILLYSAAYGLFSWLARIRSSGMVLVLVVVLVAAIRVTFSL